MTTIPRSSYIARQRRFDYCLSPSAFATDSLGATLAPALIFLHEALLARARLHAYLELLARWLAQSVCFSSTRPPARPFHAEVPDTLREERGCEESHNCERR
jgi:hypothetical protein